MKNKVLEYIYDNSMIKEGDKVLVALSGGPDSVCLLHLLHTLKDNLKIELFAAHVNHLIRGDEAFADENYAKEFCEKLNIKFFAKRICIEDIAKDKGISTEMAGRDERYGFFNEIKIKEGITKIAIAHNANDQAETLIMRIMRGTGLEGLVGIKPVRDGIYIRPILSLTREEIEYYCEVNSLNPRIDKTNLEDIYSRNKVRLKAIPFIKENFNSDIVRTLNRLSYSANVDSKFIEGIVLENYQQFCSLDDANVVINFKAFELDEAIITRLIKKSLMIASDAYNNFELKHIQDVIKLQQGMTGKRINLTNNIIVTNNYGNVIICRNKKVEKITSDELIELNVANLIKEKAMSVNYGSYKFLFEIIDNKGDINFKSESEKYFSFDGIEKIVIRARKNGDKLIPFGFKGTKKIKDILIAYKIPANDRDAIPIIEFDDDIVWVVGIKNSDLFKVKRQNKKLLKISFD